MTTSRERRVYSWASVLGACALIVSAVLFRAPGTQAQVSTTDVLQAYAFEVIAVGGTATPFTASVISPTNAIAARKAYCTNEDAAIRYRTDGGDPSTTVGHPIAVASAFTLIGQMEILRFRGIQSGGSAGELHCTYSR